MCTPGRAYTEKTIPVKSFIATEECGTSTSPAEACKANCFGIYSLGGSSLRGCCLGGSQLPLRFIRMMNGELEMLLGGCSGCGVREGAMRFPAAALPSPLTAGDPPCPGGVRARRRQRSGFGYGAEPGAVPVPGRDVPAGTLPRPGLNPQDTNTGDAFRARRVLASQQRAAVGNRRHSSNRHLATRRRSGHPGELRPPPRPLPARPRLAPCFLY